VNALIEHIKRRIWLYLCLLILGLVGLTGVRLAQGPIRIDGLKSYITSRIEKSIPNSQASLNHLDLVWFHDSNALGLRLDDLKLKDKQNRTILAAKTLEAALAIDSLLVFHMAPARLRAQEFVIALSVSSEGRYELGFDAKGDPEAFALDEAFFDLIGRETLGRPLSFIREFALSDGSVSLRQIGSDLNWTAEVARIDFSKRRDDIKANLGLVIHSDTQTSFLSASAKAKTDLKSAVINASIDNLIPSKVFPSVGLTQALSAFRAEVDGKGRATYSSKNGFEGAYIDVVAGEGSYLFGNSEQAFETLRVTADYTPKDKRINFKSFQLKSKMIDTDLFGAVHVTPENPKTKQKLSVEFDFSGPRVTGQLAEDFAAQTLRDVNFKGVYIPELRQLDILSGKGYLNSSAVETKGKVYTDEKGQLGADLVAQIKGNFSKETVFAFWPKRLTPITREDLIQRIKGGVYSNADFVLKAPPGHLGADGLTNDDLRLDFQFRDMGLSFHPNLKDATNLKGKGRLLGNRFDLSLEGGNFVKVPLTGGGVSLPSFTRADKTDTHIWLTGKGKASDIIEAVDPLTKGQLLRSGLTDERLSGEAEAKIDIKFPTFGALTLKNLNLTFEGIIRKAGLKEAALGWDLTDGDLKVQGDYLADSVVIKGPAILGPYKGDVSYRTQFAPKMQYIDFDGSFNARQFGGSPTERVAIKGNVEVFNNKGTGQIRSDIFNGSINWTGDDSRPSHLILSGQTQSQGLVRQGLPIFARFKPDMPTEIELVRSGDIWSGAIQAEGFSGDLAYIDGQNPRLIYKALIDPERARFLGLGGLPIFQEPRTLSVNIGLDAQSKEARIKLDDIDAILDWTEDNETPLRTLTASLTPEQLYKLGLPRQWFAPSEAIAVKAIWSQDKGGINGDIRFGDQPIAFSLPDSRAHQESQLPPWLQVQASLSEGFLNLLGYKNHSLEIDGSLKATVSLYPVKLSDEAISLSNRGAVVVNIDATEARLKLPRSDWIKPIGETAALAMSIDERSSQGGVNLSRIFATGARLSIEGRASFKEDGRIDFADFSKIYLKDFANLSLKIFELEAPQTQIISLTGQQLDLRPWFNPSETASDSRPLSHQDSASGNRVFLKPSAKQPLRFLAKLDRLTLSNEGYFTEAEIEAEWDGKNLIKGEASVLSPQGRLVTLELTPEDDFTRFSFEADDLGDFVRTSLGDKRLIGGTAIAEGTYRNGQIDGVIKGENIRIKQIPALTQVLSLASLKGLSDTLTGEGISFEDYEFPFRHLDQFLFIDKGWAKGQALRINVWGSTDFKSKTMDYEGILIPAYGANTFFGAIPLVGDIITSNRGEGVLGIKYSLKGNMSDTKAEINPLSLLLPGFLRRLIDKERPDPLPKSNLTERANP
jgi:hypothetical protein